MDSIVSLFADVLNGPISYAFAYLAIPVSVFFIVMVGIAIFSNVVDDVAIGGAELETEVETHHGDSGHHGHHSDWSFVKFLTLKNVIYFLTFFAWTGLTALYNGTSETVALIIAIFTAVLLTTFLNILFLLLVKSEKAVVYNYNATIGKTGTAYLSMQPSEVGQITIEIQGSLETVPARNIGNSTIATGENVKVDSVVDGRLNIIKL